MKNNLLYTHVKFAYLAKIFQMDYTSKLEYRMSIKYFKYHFIRSTSTYLEIFEIPAVFI